MPRIYHISTSPKIASNNELLKDYLLKQKRLESIDHIEIIKRSIDARQRKIKINLILEVYIDEEFVPNEINIPDYQNVNNKEEIIIVGAGPAGLFAALKCLELGLKPVILERGKDVSSRRRDLAKLNKEHIVNENSNYCFGEGGAGTFSDGKLYTRSKKRGKIINILETFVAHGASTDILVNAHPHIGTNKLPQIIEGIRKTIIDHGGEIMFDAQVVDFNINNDIIENLTLSNGNQIKVNKLILATGHSARDIYALLVNKDIAVALKPFALGVRVEHPQLLIDQIQYHCSVRSEYLPPSSYNILKQVNGRSVHSFCMCPGGIIAPCATKQDEVVTNGWSPSKRNSPNANSGIVVQLEESDFKEYQEHGVLAGMQFQRDIENKAWEMAGSTQKVPAQRLSDFIDNKRSSNIPKTSYFPGTESVKLSELFPEIIYDSLKKAFIHFGNIMKGYVTNNAVVHAPESRTSSPVRIPRDKMKLNHIRITNLYPCGEGAGYAGGIISAAIDGERCAKACTAVQSS